MNEEDPSLTPEVTLDRGRHMLIIMPDGKTERHCYEIDLERSNTPAQILDWIYQLDQKIWMTNDLMGQIIQAYDDACEKVFHAYMQSVFCGSGIPREADWKKGV